MSARRRIALSVVAALLAALAQADRALRARALAGSVARLGAAVDALAVRG